MTFRSSTRRRFPAALLLTAVLLTVPAASATAGSGSQGRYSEVPRSICRVDWRDGTWHVKKLIRCAVHRWSVPGGVAKALYIANRESNFHPRAYNSYSGASGIYQHLRRYWPGRATAYGFRGSSAFNARANIIVSIRMVHRMGSWQPWGG
ncbi:MAG TPA: hypothetical protein VI341_03270 [Actinomycetota bacterium]